jgi:hypothetical protein
MEKSLSKERNFKNKIFQIGQITNVIEETLIRFNPIKNFQLIIGQTLPDGTLTQNVYYDLQPLEQICSLVDLHIGVYFHQSLINEIHFRGFQKSFSIEVDASEVKIVNEAFKLIVDLLEITESQMSVEINPVVNYFNLVQRLEKLENVVFGPDKRLQCFISYRFSEGNDVIVQKIRQFLENLDIEVITGERYEPKKISDKVKSKLSQPLDLIIQLISEDGESMWTRDEIGAALYREIPFVPIIEKGVKFTPGLFGDVEWIEYETGHIGDSFIKLLDAVQDARRKKIKRSAI